VNISILHFSLRILFLIYLTSNEPFKLGEM
jgi:hypothetical protein